MTHLLVFTPSFLRTPPLLPSVASRTTGTREALTLPPTVVYNLLFCTLGTTTLETTSLGTHLPMTASVLPLPEYARTAQPLDNARARQPCSLLPLLMTNRCRRPRLRRPPVPLQTLVGDMRGIRLASSLWAWAVRRVPRKRPSLPGKSIPTDDFRRLMSSRPTPFPRRRISPYISTSLTLSLAIPEPTVPSFWKRTPNNPPRLPVGTLTFALPILIP